MDSVPLAVGEERSRPLVELAPRLAEAGLLTARLESPDRRRRRCGCLYCILWRGPPTHYTLAPLFFFCSPHLPARRSARGLGPADTVT